MLYLQQIVKFFIGQLIIYDVWGEPPSSTAGWTTNVGGPDYTTTCVGQTIIGGTASSVPEDMPAKLTMDYQDTPQYILRLHLILLIRGMVCQRLLILSTIR